MNTWRALVAMALAWLCGCAGPAAERAARRTSSLGPGMNEIRLEVAGTVRRAALWVPPGAVDSQPLPLVVYLHGMGERGDALEHLRFGLGKAITAHPERFTGYVILPQCPADRLWIAVDQSWAKGLDGGAEHVDAALDWALTNLPIDRSRVTLTGLSMGGFGALVHGARRAAEFSALCAVCGGGRSEDAPALAQKPIWLLHGEADTTVSIEQSRRIAAAIRAVRPDAPLRLTEYAGVGHNAWDRAYGDPEVVEFLFRAGFR